MYPVTFYSFKGGVGRTQALVNISFELAKRGKRVLMVDFDLEAPGLDTFDLSPAGGKTPGLIDYFSKYIDTLSPPKVEPYLEEIDDEEIKQGHLWIMPSGIRDERYERRLREIDWPKLYGELDGYLMIENLKAQWEEALAPDYVLIDSRTGHTDVAGICTRQLPEAVVILFLPNEQNLRGLTKIVADIRAETEPPRNKEILKYFVMSNVPELDDEDGILDRRLEAFKKELGFEGLSQTIHTYQSLLLLDQAIFTKVKPKSQLSREYQALTDLIIRDNVKDREGAVRFLRSLVERSTSSMVEGGINEDQRLDRIATAFPVDSEILLLRAAVRMRQAKYADAIPLLDDAIALGEPSGVAYLRRAGCRVALGERVSAGADVTCALERGGLSEPEVVHAVQLLRDTDGDRTDLLRGFGYSRALRNLTPSTKLLVSTLLRHSREEHRAAANLLQEILKESTANDEQRLMARNNLALTFIGMGRFEDAIAGLAQCEANRLEDTKSIQTAFNYAMASWAIAQNVPVRSFEKVIELHEQSQQRRSDANYPQCIAIAYWATGNRQEAEAQLKLAKDRASVIRGQVFSCWRYATVGASDFLEDLESMSRMFNGEDLTPAFFSRA